MNGILSVSSFCEVCRAVSRSISWARCLPVVIICMLLGRGVCLWL